jgi:soluble lytic murein transglycosylase-like protein
MNAKRMWVFAAALAIGSLVAPRAAVGAELGFRTADRDLLRGLVYQLSTEIGVDPHLMDCLVRVESGYNPFAVSRKGAMGLMQLMPATAKRLRVDDPFDPEQNLRGGMREFLRLVDRYTGDYPLALAAYNAGEGAVKRYRGVPPYSETRNYVRQIMTMYTGRPYTLSSRRVTKVPVRILRDPGTGKAMITNESSSETLARGRRNGAPALRGGFGAD